MLRRSIQRTSPFFQLRHGPRAMSSGSGVQERPDITPDSIAEDHAENYKLAIVGTGWAGYHLFNQCQKYRADIESQVGKPVDVVVVSRRNHFLYTPLLASTTVGTLEFRSIIEPLRERFFRHEDDFHHSSVRAIDPDNKKLQLTSEIGKRDYELPYDTLILSHGSHPQTFGIKGVQEHAYFLKEVAHARAIRDQILANVEQATDVGLSTEEKKRLLHFVVVGGGPTGVEFCAELYDFLEQDLTRMYPKASKHLAVTLLDAGDILTGFDSELRNFAMRKLQSRPNTRIVKKNCVAVTEDGVTLEGGEVLSSGMVVWTAGVGPNDLTRAIDNLGKSKRGNILTNEFCQVLEAPEVEKEAPYGLPLRSNIFAIGDCAEIDGAPLPATAQKAEGQAEYLLKMFRGKTQVPPPAYAFHNKGMMAYVGGFQGLFEGHVREHKNEEDDKVSMKGFVAWLIWRSAYLTKLGNWRLRMQVPVDWLKSLLIGRDSSRF